MELLELRLKELYDHIDYFVLVEATKTHRGKNKPLHFEENKKRFEKWKDKIIHVVVRDMPKVGMSYGKNWRINSLLSGGAWKLEKFQQNQIVRGLKNCKDEDIIIQSDSDEIPNPKKIPEMVERLKKGDMIVIFDLKMYNYYLNGYVCSGWYGAKAYTFKTLKENFWFSIDQARRLRNLKLRMGKLFGKEHFSIIKNGGWHFSYLGDADFIRDKIGSLCHFENDTEEFKDTKKIKERVEKGLDLFGSGQKIKYVEVDDTFPETILKDKKKYRKLIK